MNHDVAVHAGATSGARAWVNHIGRGTRNRRSGFTCETTLDACNNAGKRGLAVVWAAVTFLAQERSTRFQQRRDVGAVWAMAIGAVFAPVSYTHLRAHETDSYLVC